MLIFFEMEKTIADKTISNVIRSNSWFYYTMQILSLNCDSCSDIYLPFRAACFVDIRVLGSIIYEQISWKF